MGEETAVATERLSIAAAECLVRDLAASNSVWMTKHFRKRLVMRGYTTQDAYRVLRVGKIESSPRWDSDKQNFEVSVRGRTTDGRDTRVVLGMRRVGASTLVTIVEIGADSDGED